MRIIRRIMDNYKYLDGAKLVNYSHSIVAGGLLLTS